MYRRSCKAGTATWAFVVLAQDDTCHGPIFHRIGFAAGFVNDDVSPCERTAQDAEATALVAMAEFLLSQNLAHIQVHCHFDSTAAGWGALGHQATPNWRGKCSPRQHLARVLMSILERKCQEVKGFHIHAHEGCPWNECVDSLALAVRQGWCPLVEAQLRSHVLYTHPLRDWAWIDAAPSLELPSLHEVLVAEYDTNETGWQDRVFEGLTNTTARPITCDVLFATINVGTMQYQDEGHHGASEKSRELMHQFLVHKVDIIGIQESRAKFSQTMTTGDYCRLISAGTGGHAGVELWIRTSLFDELGSSLDASKDLCTWRNSERILAVTIDCAAMQLNVVVCYMPQEGLSSEVKTQWWNKLEQVIQDCPSSFPTVLLGDMNAKVGSVDDTHVGTLHADLENESGTLFRSLCNAHAFTVCNSHEAIHKGEGWTYQDHRGSVSRLDYVCVSDDILPGVVCTWVDKEVEVLAGDHDHRPVILHMQLSRQIGAAKGFKRRIMYDRVAARQAKRTRNLDLFEYIPPEPWTRDANAHWSSVRDQLQNLAQAHHPRPKRQQRQVYFSRTCWNLVCQRKDLRQIAREQARNVAFQQLKGVFQAWSLMSAERRDTENSVTTERIHLHNARLQWALTQHLREQIDKQFRKVKRQEWKAWVQGQMKEQIQKLNEDPASLYQILQPKKMITRAQNKHRKPLPGFQDTDGQWVTSKERIAWAWEAQFGAIENAVDVQVNDLYVQATQQRRSPMQATQLTQAPTLYEFEAALRKMHDAKAPGHDSLGA